MANNHVLFPATIVLGEEMNLGPMLHDEAQIVVAVQIADV
jgi:hypothetical protein